MRWLILIGAALVNTTLWANDCSNPFIISSFPYSYSGTSCGAGNDFPEPICQQTGWGASEDIVFQVDFIEGATYIINASVGSGNLGVFIYNVCNPADACQTSITVVGSTLTNYCYTASVTGTHYIVIDRDVTGCSSVSFSIDIDVTPPTEYSMFNGTINACSGTLFDPRGRCDYENNELSRTLLCPSVAGQCVQLDFVNFNTESGFDELAVYESDATGCTRGLINTYSGNLGAFSVQATGTIGNCLYLEFTSDGSITAPGFEANISCVPCSSGPLTGNSVNMQNGRWIVNCGSSANFYDSGGPGADYANSEDYTLVICPNTPGQYVQVTFNSFNVENNFDFLYIYNGSGGSCGTCLGSYTGTNSPGTITSYASDGCLTFRFTSDGSVTAPGWSATVTCVSTPGPEPVNDGYLCSDPYCATITAPYTFQAQNSACGSSFEFPACTGCGAFNYADAPYFIVFTIATGGTLVFDITPNPNVDIDFALWRIPSNYDCSDLGPPIRASWDLPPSYTIGLSTTETDLCECASGNGYVAAVNVSAGESYLLLIDDFAGVTNNPQNITVDFSGSTATFGSTPSECPTPLPIALLADVAEEEQGNKIRWGILLGEYEQQPHQMRIVLVQDPEGIKEEILYEQSLYTTTHGTFLHPTQLPGNYTYRLELFNRSLGELMGSKLLTLRRGNKTPWYLHFNPTKRTLTLNAPSNITRVELIDMVGRIVYFWENVEQQRTTLNIPKTISAGMYSVNVYAEDYSRFTKKVAIR